VNPGLRYLLAKKPVGWLRMLRRRTKSMTLLVLGAGGILFVLVGPQLFLAMQATGESVTHAVRLTHQWGPAAMTLLALLGISSGMGLVFRPSEIDFLFPAPVSRRELLLYYTLGKLMTVLLSALWVAIFTLRWAPHWYSGIAGLFLGLSFLQMTSQLASLAVSSVSVRLGRRARRVLLFGSLGVAAIAVLVIRQQARISFLDAVRAVVDSTTAKYVTAPARVFVEVFVSESSMDFVLWGSAGIAILGAMFLLIVRLDVAYAEGALASSQIVQERLRRAQSGGSAVAVSAGKVSIPLLPWLGGAGPLAWRQTIEVVRGIRRIMFLALTLVGVPVAVVFASPRAEEGAPVSLVMVLMMTVMTAQNLTLDFRRDLDRMAYLKSLPLRPASLALGQILPGIFLLTVLQGVAITVVILVSGANLPWPLAILLLPFNWIALAVDNVLFLKYPYRIAPKEAGNVTFMGRRLVTAMAEMLALGVSCGIATAFGALCWFGVTKSWLLVSVAATVLLCGIGVGVTRLLGTAFRDFDIVKDVPA